MRPRFRIMLASALAIVSGACAASTGTGGGGGGGAAPRPNVASQLPQGEQPVPNANTRDADRQLGIALIQSGDAARAAYQAAAAAAERGMAADPRNPLPFKQAGQAYIGLEEYEKADAALDEAEKLRPIYKLEIDPMREQAWIAIYREGAEFLNTGQYEQVVPIYEKAGIIYDQRPEIMVLLGQIYTQLGDSDKAIENLNKALAIIESDRIMEMDSATAEVWREQAADIPPALAQAYLSAERFQEAVATLRPMLDKDPSNADYARTLAGVYARMNLSDSVRAVYQRMEEAAGGNLTAYDYTVIGLGYYDLEEWMRAAASLQSALRVAPKDRDAAEWRARSLFYLVQDQETGGGAPDRTVLQQLADAAQLWSELDPNSGTAYTMLAQAYNKMNATDPRVNQAIQTLEGLKVRVDQLQIRRERGGGATVVGDIQNVTGTVGQNVTMRFTFYSANGAVLGTQDQIVRLPAQGASEVLQVQFDSDQAVDGYTYQVIGL